MTSSFFGDELWPSDKVNFTNSALNNAPSPVTVVYVSAITFTHPAMTVSVGTRMQMP
jgi:hypothetical protein